MWQFMVSTGRRFMRIDNVVDERLDPYKSTRAAALLMQQNYEVTRAWPLAITAYNHGASGMRRAIEQVGTDDIAVIVRKYKSRSFGFASRNFYTALLAAVDVDQGSGAVLRRARSHAPDNSRVLVLPDYIAVGTLAKSLGVSRDTLESMNLSLKADGVERHEEGAERATSSACRHRPAIRRCCWRRCRTTRGIRNRRRICSMSFSAAKRCRRSRRDTAHAYRIWSRSIVCRGRAHQGRADADTAGGRIEVVGGTGRRSGHLS